jgi:hypothetical protein
MHHQLMTLLSLNVVIWSLVWGLLSSLTGCTVSSARSEQELVNVQLLCLHRFGILPAESPSALHQQQIERSLQNNTARMFIPSARQCHACPVILQAG